MRWGGVKIQWVSFKGFRRGVKWRWESMKGQLGDVREHLAAFHSNGKAFKDYGKALKNILSSQKKLINLIATTMIFVFFVQNNIFRNLTLTLTFWPWRSPWIMNIIGDYHEMIYQSKSHENEVLHMLLALFGRKQSLDYLTLKLTFWHWRWPWIMKII